MIIRPAKLKDAGVICAIWNPIIRDTLVTFNPVEKTPESVSHMLKDKAQAKEPFLLACAQDEVLGFVTYGPFRGGEGYKHTVEHTIILSPAARGKGIGAALMAQIEQMAKSAGKHSIWAGVSAQNTGGVAFHTALGYRTVATLPEVGYKFDTWIDLVLLQKIL